MRSPSLALVKHFCEARGSRCYPLSEGWHALHGRSCAKLGSILGCSSLKLFYLAMRIFHQFQYLQKSSQLVLFTTSKHVFCLKTASVVLVGPQNNLLSIKFVRPRRFRGRKTVFQGQICHSAISDQLFPSLYSVWATIHWKHEGFPLSFSGVYQISITRGHPRRLQQKDFVCGLFFWRDVLHFTLHSQQICLNQTRVHSLATHIVETLELLMISLPRPSHKDIRLSSDDSATTLIR